jgi:hypothetical protein
MPIVPYLLPPIPAVIALNLFYFEIKAAVLSPI